MGGVFVAALCSLRFWVWRVVVGGSCVFGRTPSARRAPSAPVSGAGGRLAARWMWLRCQRNGPARASRRRRRALIP